MKNKTISLLFGAFLISAYLLAELADLLTGIISQ